MIAVCADHHAIRPHEILDGRPLSEKFWIRDHVEPKGIRLGLRDDLTKLFAGPHGNGRLRDNDLVPGHVPRDPFADFFDIREIRGTVAPRRRPDGDKDDQRLIDGLRNVRGKRQSAFPDSLGHQFLESRLIKRDLALFEFLDSSAVAVHAGDVDAELRKTSSRHESDIPAPDHTNVHGPLLTTERNVFESIATCPPPGNEFIPCSS